MAKLLKGTKSITRVSGSYSLLKPMGNPRGTLAYTKHDKVYALYDFSTDISSTGDLPDLGPNGFHLQPSASSINYRPDAPTQISGPYYGGSLVSNFALGFPTHHTDFDATGNGNSIISTTIGNNNFSFTDGTKDLPFSISAWFEPDNLTDTGYIVSKYQQSPLPNQREYIFGQSSVVTGGIFIQLYDEDTNAHMKVYSSPNVLEAHKAAHLVATYDGSASIDGLKLYVNGVDKTDTINRSGTYVRMRVTDTPFVIGNRANAASSKSLDGDLAQVCVWSEELTPIDVKALYEARNGVTKYGSGIVSLPTRVQLRNNDYTDDQYPIKIVPGSKFSKNRIPFDDTNTINFVSSFGSAKIKFFDKVMTGDYIDLTGSNGVEKKRFRYTLAAGFPPIPSDNVEIPLTYDGIFEGSAVKIWDSPKDASSLFVKALSKFPSLGIDAKQSAVVEERFNPDGSRREKGVFTYSVDLKHKIPGTGSFEQGNVISVGRVDGSDIIELEKPKLSPEQFYIGMNGKVKFSELSYNQKKSFNTAFPNTQPDIQTSGSIVPGISDFNYKPTTNFVFKPFNESKINLIRSPFDLVGTDSTVLEGFSNPLSSKSQFVIDLSSSQEKYVYFATGSPEGEYVPAIENISGSGMAYWNSLDGRWEMLDPGTIETSKYVTEVSDPFSTNFGTRRGSCLGFSLNTSGVIKGTNALDTGFSPPTTAPVIQRNLKNLKVLENAGEPISQHAFPWGAQYNATSSQEIKMSNYISQPFLLEKMKVEIDGIFGVGTSADVGTKATPRIKNLFVLNQTTDGNNPHIIGDYPIREERLDGTTVHIENADHASLGRRELVTWAKIAFTKESSNLFTHVKTKKRVNEIFEKMVRVPDAKIASQPFFTGSFRFDLVPKLALSSDVVSFHGIRAGTSEATRRHLEVSLADNRLGGSDLLGGASGRQIASSLGSTETDTHQTGSHRVAGFNNLNLKKTLHKQSPYLLYPTDRLVIGWQNINLGQDFLNRVGIREDIVADHLPDLLNRVKITFFGSNIRNSREFHDTHSDNTTSNQIHEVIYGEPVLDQFDVENVTSMSGSIWDALFFGEFKASGTRNMRGRRASIAKGEAGPTGSLNRNISMFNKDTKIKDSLAPPIENLLTDETFFSTTTSAASGRDISVRVGGVTRRSVVLSNNPASSSFRLLKATGLFNSSRFTRKVTISPASNYLETPGGGPSTKADFLTFDLSPPGGHAAYSVLSGSAALVNGIKSFGSPELAVNPITDPEKLLSPSMKHAISGLMYAAPLVKFGNYSWPVIRAGIAGVMPLIRGYKYGFYATQPMSPNTVFRRDHYGYFRDLIETGPETATLGLINEDTGKEIIGWPNNDGPVKVRFISRGGTPDIDPLDTNSQNLSTFSTSSLPYYDGMTVDRDVVASPPPDMTDRTTLEEHLGVLIDGDA